MTSSLKLLPLWIPHGDELGAKEIFPPMLHFVWAFYHSDGNETRAVELGNNWIPGKQASRQHSVIGDKVEGETSGDSRGNMTTRRG